jgi:hypothetical protein
MKSQVIRIQYAENETGSAELLEGRLARITECPLFTETLFRNSIVRLTHRPDEFNTIPAVVEVIWTPFPKRGDLFYRDKAEFMVLRGLFAQLHAECLVVVECQPDRVGLLAVGHHEGLNPRAVAEAIGMPQQQYMDSLNEGPDQAQGATVKDDQSAAGTPQQPVAEPPPPEPSEQSALKPTGQEPGNGGEEVTPVPPD